LAPKTLMPRCSATSGDAEKMVQILFHFVFLFVFFAQTTNKENVLCFFVFS